MMSFQRPVLFIPVLLLAGCTFIPVMQKPDLPVADTWPEVPELSTEAQTAAADITLEAFYTSPTLQKLVHTALAENRDLRIAALNVLAARSLYRIERADRLPSVTGDVQAVRTRLTEAQTEDGVGSVTTSAYSASVGVGYEVDLFGRVRSLNAAALERYLGTEAARDAVQHSLVAEIADAYLQWLGDRKALSLTEETLRLQEQSRDLIKAGYDNGVSSKLDLAQVTSVVETARADLARYHRLIALDRNALLLLVGSTDAGLLDTDETLDDIQLAAHLPANLPSEVLLLRPDIVEAEHALRAANADIGVARAAFFPRIALTASYGFASNSLGDLFSSAGAGAWSFVPNLTVPIFQAGRNRANLAYSETNREIAVARYEQTIQVAFREVADALAALHTYDAELKAVTNRETAAQEAYDLSYQRYKAGIDRFLSALDAQRDLVGAQLRRIDIERDKQQTLTRLYKALGGGKTATP